jgi:DNA-binding NarL/FixJ family response regulator
MEALRPNEGKFAAFIVEDHPMFREQLTQLINRETDMFVCGEADNVADALRTLETNPPDIVILDITLKGRSGLELLKDLKARAIDVPALVLSMHDELLYAERVLRAGGRGYITKHETSKELMTAIRTVLRGEVYLGKQMSSRVLENFSSGASPQAGVSQLTDRELEVFEMIGQGRPTRDICARLNLGASTVDTYRARIKTKLNLDNAAALTHEAIRWVSGHEAAVG